MEEEEGIDYAHLPILPIPLHHPALSPGYEACLPYCIDLQSCHLFYQDSPPLDVSSDLCNHFSQERFALLLPHLLVYLIYQLLRDTVYRLQGLL